MLATNGFGTQDRRDIEADGSLNITCKCCRDEIRRPFTATSTFLECDMGCISISVPYIVIYGDTLGNVVSDMFTEPM